MPAQCSAFPAFGCRSALWVPVWVFFNSFAIKAGRKKFSATVVEELSLEKLQQNWAARRFERLRSSITRVAESIYDGDVPPYVSEHPSIHKAETLLAQKRAVEFKRLCERLDWQGQGQRPTANNRACSVAAEPVYK